MTCTATDLSNTHSTTTFTVTVKGAAAQLSDLQTEVTGVGPGVSFQDKVQDALTAVNAGNIPSACSTLTGFISEVQAQSGKQLTVAQANQLIADTTRIRAVLGCT